MDPLFTLILAMALLGLTQISLDYEVRRLRRNASEAAAIIADLAKDAGWTVTSDKGVTCVTPPNRD